MSHETVHVGMDLRFRIGDEVEAFHGGRTYYGVVESFEIHVGPWTVEPYVIYTVVADGGKRMHYHVGEEKLRLICRPSYAEGVTKNTASPNE